MTSIPRPPGPSTQPPSGPLPSIPTAKGRQSSAPSSYANKALPSTPAALRGLPNPTVRTSSGSLVPTTGSLTLNSAPPTAFSQTPDPKKTQPHAEGGQLRKVASYNVFPKPPNQGGGGGGSSARPGSQHSSSSSVSTTARNSVRTSARSSGVGIGSRPGNSALSSRQSTSSTLNSSFAKDGSASASPLDATPSESSMLDEDTRGRTRSTTKDKGNVIVSVRVRPDYQGSDSSQTEWRVDGGGAMVSYSGPQGGEYQYDNVFSTHDKNARVYDSAAKRLVRRVMEGYHGTVFAYGMTGTGKTFSMQGTATSPGVIPLAITDIFSFIRETPQREFLLRVSYLEIYNEKIHDLLAVAPGAGPDSQREEIKLREDSRRGVYASPLKEEIVQSPTQLLRVIARGDNARRTGSTQFNARSSRSHAVVQIVVESRERNAAKSGEKAAKGAVPGGVRVSTLSLIDLAGSERAAEDKERRTEGAHINKSLLTLGTVISKLSAKRDKNGTPMDKDGKHLPYRDSKLTRLLQPALSGGSLISILCTIHIGAASNPTNANTNVNETLNTLKFAARARNNIVSHARKAEESHSHIGDAGSRALLDRYRLEIQDLRRQLDQANKTSKDSDREDQQKEEKPEPREHGAEQRHEEQMLEMQLARTALKERIEHLNRLILSSKSVGVNTGGRSTFSSLSFGNTRTSTLSANESFYGGARSIRSSTSTTTLDASGNLDDRRVSSITSTSTGAHGSVNGGDEDDLGDNGDGTASLAMQVRALRADVADKNRYISTLEKRLLQARRNSRSRMSASFINRIPNSITEDPEAAAEALREKDSEITELRARLDDKDRMITALRGAARKRDIAGAPNESRPGSKAANRSEKGSRRGSVDTQSNGGRPTLDLLNRTSNYKRRSSVGSSASAVTQSTSRTSGQSYNSPTSPVGRLASLNSQSGERPRVASPNKRAHGVDEMTRMLDEMIRAKVESGSGGPLSNVHANRDVGQKPGEAQPAALPSPARVSTTASGLKAMALSSPAGSSPVSAQPPTPTSATSQSSTSSVRERRLSRHGLDNRRLSGWEIDVTRKRQSVKGAATSSNGQPSPALTTPVSTSDERIPDLPSPERATAAINGAASNNNSSSSSSSNRTSHRDERNSRAADAFDKENERNRSTSRPRTASTDVSVETVVPDEHNGHTISV